jgi:hypothetical protein
MAAPKLFTGFSNVLNVIIHTGGATPGPPANGPYPGVYCSVYDSGTTNLAAILGPNPFLVNADGSFSFYGPASEYELLFSTSVSAVVSQQVIQQIAANVAAVQFDGVGPSAPSDNNFWITCSGVTPNRLVQVFVRDQGVTKMIHSYKS